HLAELQRQAEQMENFNLHIVESAAGVRVSQQYISERVDGDISQAKVYFCGPTPMRKSLKAQFTQAGLPNRQFHYEEFEIRSGVGLRKLLSFVFRKLGYQNLMTN
ncbi:MAG: hypothetical protein ACPG51_21175, partial [Thiolinea sp.]